MHLPDSLGSQRIDVSICKNQISTVLVIVPPQCCDLTSCTGANLSSAALCGDIRTYVSMHSSSYLQFNSPNRHQSPMHLALYLH